MRLKIQNYTAQNDISQFMMYKICSQYQQISDHDSLHDHRDPRSACASGLRAYSPHLWELPVVAVVLCWVFPGT